MKTVQLEDHHPEYVMRVLDARWQKLDEEKRGLLPGDNYRVVLSEMERIEAIQERLRNAE